MELLNVLFSRVVLELESNIITLNELRETVGLCRNARVDIWDWAKSIVDSFSTSAYYNLISTGLNKELPKNIDDLLYRTYKNIIGIAHMVKKARLAHSFYYGYSTDEKSANELFDLTRSSIGATFGSLNQSFEVIKKYCDGITN